jgi:glutaminyl-tRNA synthetase
LNGEDSPFRYRKVEENLDLFARMRGIWVCGQSFTAKLIWFPPKYAIAREPLMYRIRHANITARATIGIYPMYDFAHGQSDSPRKSPIPFVPLEFDVHRPCTTGSSEKLNIFPFSVWICPFEPFTHNRVMIKRKLSSNSARRHRFKLDDLECQPFQFGVVVDLPGTIL